MNNEVIIIDYGAGNVKSIANVLTKLGFAYEITSDKDKIENAKRLIFPGQGHFGQAMSKLKETGLDLTIKSVIEKGIPFLGICLGLQVLFEKSEEAPNVKGLSIFEGEVKKFVQGKTPQIGWNNIRTTKNNSYLSDDYFYFVNSYYVLAKDEKIISSKTNYYIDFCSSVEYKNVVGVQFHPEKSAEAGMEFFKNWLK